MERSFYTVYDLEIRSCFGEVGWLCVQSYMTLEQAKKAMEQELYRWHRDENGVIASSEVRIVRRRIIREVVS